MSEVPPAKTETETPALAYKGKRRNDGTSKFQEFGILIVIALLFILLSVFGGINSSGKYANSFLNLDNLVNGITKISSGYAIMAIGMTLVIISGGIDISIGSILGVSAMYTAIVLQNLTQMQQLDSGKFVTVWEANSFLVWLTAIGVSLGIGLICGLFNGVLIVFLRLHPFVVTLGTMAIFRWATNMPQLKMYPTQGHSFPSAFAEPMQYKVLGNLEFMPLIVMLFVFVLGWIYLSHTVWGRETYAVGGNEEAAKFSGLNIGAIKLRTYAIMGLLAGVAGLVSVGRYGTTDTTNGTGDELTVIASAVVGGASLLGGRGTALGAVLGALVLGLIHNGITVMHLKEEHRLGIVGAAIIVAAALDRISENLRQRRLMASSRHAA